MLLKAEENKFAAMNLKLGTVKIQKFKHFETAITGRVYMAEMVLGIRGGGLVRHRP